MGGPHRSGTGLSLANRFSLKKGSAMKDIWRTAALMLPALAVGVLAGNALAFDESDTDIKKGKEIYNQTCIACHGATGKGEIPGAPNFTENGGRLSKSDSVLFDSTKNGFRSPGSPMAMPKKGGNTELGDQDIKDVIGYMHKAFGKS